MTHSLPLREWYYEVKSSLESSIAGDAPTRLKQTLNPRSQSTSEWTLDYPPFFAYYEWLLSQAARLADPGMLVVESLEYFSWQTVYFQRSTVILSDSVLALALYLCVQDNCRWMLANADMEDQFCQNITDRSTENLPCGRDFDTALPCSAGH